MLSFPHYYHTNYPTMQSIKGEGGRASREKSQASRGRVCRASRTSDAKHWGECYKARGRAAKHQGKGLQSIKGQGSRAVRERAEEL